MNILKRFADNNNLTEKMAFDIAEYAAKKFNLVIKNNNRFLNLLGGINRVIINCNNKFNLPSEIERFTAMKFAKLTYKGFTDTYNYIRTQTMPNIASNLQILKDINIDKNLDSNKREKIFKIICDNLVTKDLQFEILYSIHTSIYDIFDTALYSILSNSFQRNNICRLIANSFSPRQSNNQLNLVTFFSAWVQFYPNNFIEKINNIIHDTVPIRYNNLANYDDNPNLDENGTNPNTWIKYTDKEDPKHGIQISDAAPIYFSKIRISPLVVLDNEVLFSENSSAHHNDLINSYKTKIKKDADTDNLEYTDGVQSILEELGAHNMGVGSLFNGTIALLEYVTDGKEQDIVDENNLIRPNNGNQDAIVRALQAKGIKKIYIQNVSPWVSREYERIAKLKGIKK